MTDPQLSRMCRTWQKRLRLQDWRITIRFADATEMGDEEAHNDWEDEEIWSRVRILAGMDDARTEHRLVHELLHLRLNDWDTDYYHQPKETAINLLADSLCAAYRPRRRKKTAAKKP